MEAGLGGRYDATSVIPSRVQVLTGVGLEHTRWLGPRIEDIAEEKLAVVQEGATLVTAHDLDPAARASPSAWRASAARGWSRADPRRGRRDPTCAAAGAFQRGNFALAAAAAEAFLGAPLEPARWRPRRRETRVPGRMDVVGQDPLDRLRRRPQPVRRRGARGLARRGARRPPPAGGGDRGARGQGRRRDAARPAAALRARGVHALRQPAFALARHAREPRREARSGASRPRRSATRARPWTAPACWPGRGAPSSRPARST